MESALVGTPPSESANNLLAYESDVLTWLSLRAHSVPCIGLCWVVAGVISLSPSLYCKSPYPDQERWGSKAHKWFWIDTFYFKFGTWTLRGVRIIILGAVLMRRSKLAYGQYRKYEPTPDWDSNSNVPVDNAALIQITKLGTVTFDYEDQNTRTRTNAAVASTHVRRTFCGGQTDEQCHLGI